MSSSLFVSSTGLIQKLALKKDGHLNQFQAVLPWNQHTVGNIYAARVLDFDEGLNAAFLQLDSGNEGFLRFRSQRNKAGTLNTFPPKKGQSFIVQVQKSQAPGKRMPCTMDIGLAGFHMVFSPEGDRVRYSRRFSGDKKRISSLLKKGEVNQGGWLFRSSSENTSSSALERERRYLSERWVSITEAFDSSSTPRVLDDQDSNPLRRMLADSLSLGLENVYVDHEDTFHELMGWAKMRIPSLCDRLFLHQGSCSLFATYGIDNRFSDLTQSRVWLRSGGYLLFNQTEALTVIDVNSGKAKLGEGKKIKINIEAAVEAARHIKLREIGGIIVIDFVNLGSNELNKEVELAFHHEMGADLAQCKVEPMNGLGLLCLSRRRRLAGTWASMTEPCSTCQGTGYVINKDLFLLKLSSQIQQEVEMEPESNLYVSLSSELYQKVVEVGFAECLPKNWKVEFVREKKLGHSGFKINTETRKEDRA